MIRFQRNRIMLWSRRAIGTILRAMLNASNPLPADPLAAALARKSQSGARGHIDDILVAAGDGWGVQDIICTCGPRDREAEELTQTSSLALVLSGSFVVRDRHGTSLLSEGSYLLVEAGYCFACSH